jgi:hypothetical protein
MEDDGTDSDVDPRHAKHFAFRMTFGCQYKLTGLFKTQLADGIMGMENSKTSFWKQLYDSGKMGDEQKFSLCFSGPTEASRDGTEAGAMTFGGVERSLHKSEMVYTSKTTGSSFFGVKLRKMYLRHGDGGQYAKSANPRAKIINLGLDESVYNRGGIIVDSGTTDTYFTKGISDAFRSAFQKLSGTAFNNVGKVMTDEEVASYPTILFQLYGDEALNMAINSNAKLVPGLAGDLDPEHPFDVILAMPPSHYMEMDRSGAFTPRFYDDEDRGSVVGANAMMGHDVMFDADHRNIGWAESDCDYKRLVTDNGFTDVLDTGTSVATLPPSGNDASETKKKDRPDAGGGHAGQAPVDDIKKTVYDWSNECHDLTCRGVIICSILLALLLGCYCGRLCFSSKTPEVLGYKRAELELPDASFRDAGAYMDDPDDAEYGEFETDKEIS